MNEANGKSASIESSLLNSKSIQLVNSLVYNYGEIYNSTPSQHSVDLSPSSNRLAICTEKCLFLFSFNLKWPSYLRPIKYMINSSLSMKTTTNASSCLPILDDWIQELNDTKNQAFYINIIDFIERSKLIDSIYSKYYELEEVAKFKRKSFHRYVRDALDYRSSLGDTNDSSTTTKANRSVSSSSKKRSRSSGIDSAPSSINLMNQVIESNDDEYQRHYHLIQQTKVLDSSIYEYLTLINFQNDTETTGNQSPPKTKQKQHKQQQQQKQQPQQQTGQQSNLSDSFKHCKWNSNQYLNILCTITKLNQLLLFDCSSLTENDQIIKRMESSTSSSSSYSRVFDLKSKGHYFNLSEFWIENYLSKSSSTLNAVTTVDEFCSYVDQFTPLLIEWSTMPIQFNSSTAAAAEKASSSPTKSRKQIITDKSSPSVNSSSFDLLIVVFKSNEIALFKIDQDHHQQNNDDVGSSGGQLNIELYFSFEFNECLNHRANKSATEEEDDESLVPNLVFGSKSSRPSRITSIKFWQQTEVVNYGLLAIGLTDGEVYLTRIDFEQMLKSNNAYRQNNLIKLMRLNINKDYLSVDDIQLLRMNNDRLAPENKTVKMVIVIQKENRLEFKLVDYNPIKNEINHHDEIFYHKKHSNCSENFNNTLRSSNKLVSVKCLNGSSFSSSSSGLLLEFLLIYQSSFIELLKIRFKSSEKIIKFDYHDVKLLNDDQMINFDCESSNSSNSSKKKFALKATRNILFSSNGTLIYQINDFTKANLLLKKPAHFQINVYSLDSTKVIEKILNFNQVNLFKQEAIGNNHRDQESASSFDFKQLNHLMSPSSSNKRELLSIIDLIWLFKINLHLNANYLTTEISDFIKTNLNKALEMVNNSNKQANEFKKVELKNLLACLKRLRIICGIMATYLESCSLFETLGCCIDDELEEEEEDEEEDYDEDEEISEDRSSSSLNSNDDEDDDDDKNNHSKSSSKRSNQALMKASSRNKTKDIIKSYQYFRSFQREFELHSFKYFSLDLMHRAFEIGLEKLTGKEKLMIYLQADFSLKKNFLNELLNDQHKPFITWLNQNFATANSKPSTTTKRSTSSTTSKNAPFLLTTTDDLKCDICLRSLNVAESNEKCELVCELGHRLNRCEKSLTKLNGQEFNSCQLCNSSWNIFDKENYPNFPQLYLSNMKCIYCD